MSKLDEIKQRWAAATAGPWALFADGASSEVSAVFTDVLGHKQPNRMLMLDEESYQVLGIEETGDGFGPDQAVADAQAIAAAPEDIRWLVERVERLEAAIRTHQVERAASIPKHHPVDDFDAKLYGVLESEARHE